MAFESKVESKMLGFIASDCLTEVTTFTGPIICLPTKKVKSSVKFSRYLPELRPILTNACFVTFQDQSAEVAWANSEMGKRAFTVANVSRVGPF